MNIQKEISWELTFRVWWHFFWRYAFFGIVAAMLLSIAIGIISKHMGWPLEFATRLVEVVGMIMAFVISLWVVKRILTKRSRIGRYRLVLIEDSGEV